MVIRDLQDYWSLVRSHRKGNLAAKTALELMSSGVNRAAKAASIYLLKLK